MASFGAETAYNPHARALNSLSVVQRRTCSRLSWPWTFFVAAALQGGAVIGMEGYIFAQWQLWVTPTIHQVPVGWSMPTNLALIIFSYAYIILLILDAIRLRNSFQILTALLLNTTVLIYISFQRSQIQGVIPGLLRSSSSNGNGLVHKDFDFWGKVDALLIATPVVSGVGLGVLAVMAAWVIKDFSWVTWKSVHGDLAMRRRLLAYQIYIVILKIDFFFITAWLVDYAVAVLGFYGWESKVNIAFSGVTIIILFAAVYFVKKEILLGMIFSILCYVAGSAYFVYKLYVMYNDESVAYKFESSINTLTLYASLCIAFLVFSIATAIVCLINSGKGLKEYHGHYKAVQKLDNLPANPDYDGIEERNLLHYNIRPERLSLD